MCFVNERWTSLLGKLILIGVVTTTGRRVFSREYGRLGASVCVCLCDIRVGVCGELCTYEWVGIVMVSGMCMASERVGARDVGYLCVCVCVRERESRWCRCEYMCGVVHLWLGWSSEWVAWVGGCWWMWEIASSWCMCGGCAHMVGLEL